MSDSRAGRRELTATLAAVAAAAALALTAGGRPWAEITAVRRPPLPPVTAVVTGGEAAPLVPAAALVLLAAGGALLAVRGAGRTLVGLLMVVAGSATAWSAGRVLGGLDAVSARLGALGVPTGDLSSDIAPTWPVLATVAGLLGVAAGVLVVVRGRRWPAMGRRYERDPARAPAPAAGTDEERARAAWSALDRGEDPTADVEGGTGEPRR